MNLVRNKSFSSEDALVGYAIPGTAVAAPPKVVRPWFAEKRTRQTTPPSRPAEALTGPAPPPKERSKTYETPIINSNTIGSARSPTVINILWHDCQPWARHDRHSLAGHHRHPLPRYDRQPCVVRYVPHIMPKNKRTKKKVPGIAVAYCCSRSAHNGTPRQGYLVPYLPPVCGTYDSHPTS